MNISSSTLTSSSLTVTSANTVSITASNIIVSNLPRSDQALQAQISAITNAPGRTEKEELLRTLVASPEGRDLINYCYNPFKTYGVTCKSMPMTCGPDLAVSHSMPLIKGLLDRLSTRELTGGAAKAAVDALFAALPPAAGELLWRCLCKDLKAGVAEGSIKAIDPTLIPIFAVMRAHPYEEKRIKDFPVGVEPKLDGHRTTFIAKDGGGGFFTRTGKVVPALDHMVAPTLEALKRWAALTRIVTPEPNPVLDLLISTPATLGIPEIVLDGEMMSEEGFNETSGALRRKGEDANVRFHIFDMLSWAEFDAMGAVEVPYVDRRRRVMDLVQVAKHLGDRLTITELRVARSHDEIQQIYQEHRAAGHEGSMVKKLDGFYHKKKSHEWQKIKAEDTEDLPVVGVFQGEVGGKYENTIGGLIVERNSVEVRVSGISDADRAEMWSLWLKTCAAVDLDPKVGYKGVTLPLNGTPGSLLGRLIEVEYHEVTPDGSLRHPRFIRWRDDKTGEVDK